MAELIGRDRERLELIERLGKRRMVTVIGPAGIGKTALVRAVADQVGPTFELGAQFVDLTRVDAPDAVAGTLAAQLGFGSFDALLSSPSEQPVLVIVDNCEHVTEAAGDAVGALLAAYRSPTVLATSRSPLAIPDESLVMLGPLDVPPIGEQSIDAPAVRLFLERARDAGATMSDEDIPAVGSLCRALDGLPLALELAAAQTRLLSPAEILERLAEGVDVLARPRFRGDQRHRSLSATIEWSYRILPDDVASVLDHLGLFAGPFTMEIACAVAADAGVGEHDAANAIAQLVDASLVVTEHDREATHLRLLQTVRSFAVHRLGERGIGDQARRRFAERVAEAATDLLVIGGKQWSRTSFTPLLALYDTIASTLRWCIEHDDQPDRALLLCAVLWGIVHQGHTEEVHSLCSAALDRWPHPDTAFAADAVATLATARCLIGDPVGALSLAESTLPYAESSPTAPVTLRRALGYAARALEDRSRAMTLFTEVSTLARERGLLALALEAEVTRAQLVASDGDLATAIDMAAAVRAEAARNGSTINEVWASTVEAHLRLRADPCRDVSDVHEALDAARLLNYHAAESVNLRSLAWSALQRGDNERSAAILTELFDGLVARSGVADLHGALLTTAELLHAVGDEAWRQLAATADSLPLVGLTGRSLDPARRLPHVDGTSSLSRREAITLARDALRRVRATPRAPAPAVTAMEPDGTASAAFVDRGDLYEISFAGRSVLARKTKGLADIAQLLARPGREVHCLELMGASVEQGSTGEVLDPAARRAYEERIRDLQEDLVRAEDDHDLARAERLQVELDALVEQLASALGLAGRSRRAGSTVERARSAVTQRVRATIRRLHDDLPELGRHFDAAVTTGTFCSYRPEHDIDWTF